MRRARVLGAALAVSTALALLGCGSAPSTRLPSPPVAKAKEPQAAEATRVETAPQPSPLTAVGPAAVERARRLGGTSHRGENVYLVVISTDASEAVLAERYDQAQPHFGDTADYFVIVESRWFPQLQYYGLLLAEAYADERRAHEAAAWWSDRVEAPWYEPTVHEVSVATTSPIPVVDVDILK